MTDRERGRLRTRKRAPSSSHSSGWCRRRKDGAAFAVETLRRWWSGVGAPTYPAAHRLLVCADAGGSNDYRVRLWELELATLATKIGLPIMVCHFAPGTSKWNKIEHRLFSAGGWTGRRTPAR